MELYNPFVKSIEQIMMEMTGIRVDIDAGIKEESQEITSLGAASIITFAGGRKGRLMLDMEPELALQIGNGMMGTEYRNIREFMILSALSELNNIVAGNAITVVNNQYSLGLRLAPPIVFTGRDMIISIPRLASKSIQGTTPYGRVRMNIAWEEAAQ